METEIFGGYEQASFAVRLWDWALILRLNVPSASLPTMPKISSMSAALWTLDDWDGHGHLTLEKVRVCVPFPFLSSCSGLP